MSCCVLLPVSRIPDVIERKTTNKCEFHSPILVFDNFFYSILFVMKEIMKWKWKSIGVVSKKRCRNLKEKNLVIVLIRTEKLKLTITGSSVTLDLTSSFDFFLLPENESSIFGKNTTPTLFAGRTVRLAYLL